MKLLFCLSRFPPQIAQVPMEDGVSMYFFLPDEVTQNLTLIEEALTAEFVQDLSNTLHSVQVQLTLPVFKLGYSADLLGPLSDVGKTNLFFFLFFFRLSQMWFKTTFFLRLSMVCFKAICSFVSEVN